MSEVAITRTETKISSTTFSTKTVSTISEQSTSFQKSTNSAQSTSFQTSTSSAQSTSFQNSTSSAQSTSFQKSTSSPESASFQKSTSSSRSTTYTGSTFAAFECGKAFPNNHVDTLSETEVGTSQRFQKTCGIRSHDP
jgi:hypothetical protein